jgi:hypothetical protein
MNIDINQLLQHESNNDVLALEHRQVFSGRISLDTNNIAQAIQE